jgi:FkbM family methyltransferase
MTIAGRNIATILAALIQKRHYVAFLNMFIIYKRPLEMFIRYVFGTGNYPCDVHLRTPMGNIEIRIYSYYDILTVNEIFCRKDYQASEEDKIIIDYGANIGVSAAYFLSRNQDAVTYLFEPVASNITRLKRNLEIFSKRYVLEEVAVGESNGNVEFGYEETGRYGGIGQKTGNYISVKCIDSNEPILDVLQRHGRIDILKIDIETLESVVTQRIPREVLPKIRKIYVEYLFKTNPFADTHSMKHYGAVSQFILK